jgi:hypothetical protein
MSHQPPAPVVAAEDASMSARVVRRVPLYYAEGADPALDRPAHVRAGSGLARLGTHAGARVAVVQDDALFLAVVDPATGLAGAVALPAGPGGARQFDTTRGTKHLKLDLEACVALPARGGARGGALVALGSGSTPRRERALVAALAPDEPNGVRDARLVDAAPLYAALRAAADFAGSELNVEGAALVGDVVRLFGRGNGAARGEARAVNATCDLDARALLACLLDGAPPPRPERVVRYALGALGGVPLGFTDAVALDDGTVVFTAAAEDSPDAVEDGAVGGSAIGVIDARGAVRWTRIADADGGPLADKAEGIALAAADGARVWVVTDADDPGRPAELCEVELRAPGRAR